MGYYNWDSKDFRDGWFAGKKREKKQRPLWILLGFCLRELALFIVWALFHT